MRADKPDSSQIVMDIQPLNLAAMLNLARNRDWHWRVSKVKIGSIVILDASLRHSVPGDYNHKHGNTVGMAALVFNPGSEHVLLLFKAFPRASCNSGEYEMEAACMGLSLAKNGSPTILFCDSQQATSSLQKDGLICINPNHPPEGVPEYVRYAHNVTHHASRKFCAALSNVSDGEIIEGQHSIRVHQIDIARSGFRCLRLNVESQRGLR